jgi:hypothetical protein
MHEDGLWELFLGSLLLVLGVSAFIEDDTWRLVAHLALTVGLIVLVKVVKRTISVPRMGVAKFGPARREKRKKTKLLLLVSSLLGVALFLAAVSANDASTWIRSYVGLVDLFVGAWAFIVFGGMAYWLDLPRMLLVGLVYALVFSHLLPVSTATTALVGGALLAIPGLVMFIRFLQKYPLPAEAEVHGNG